MIRMNLLPEPKRSRWPGLLLALLAVVTVLGFWNQDAMSAEKKDVLHWLIRGNEAHLERFLREQNLKAKPVFSATERKFLTKKKRHTMASARKLKLSSSEEAARLRTLIRRQGLRLNLQPDFVVRAKSVKPKRTGGDRLSVEQWALKNTGRTHREFIDDFSSKYIQGVVGEDVNLPAASKQGAGIIVATLDTGLDLNHPDLKNQVAYKSGECKALQEWRKCFEEEDRQTCDEKLGKVDTDGNGYPMDCHGWNMTGEENETTGVIGDPEMKDPEDIAHGSHVAGIIAAENGNEIGISGIAPRSKILPVRVIDTQVGKGQGTVAHEEDATSLISVVVRGMLYAISSKANVINLSLGWDRIANELTMNPETEVPFMQEAVDLAREEGILVVGSAGNDSTDALVYPCQYRGVLCVAAHAADGNIASFSNYGSGVEIAAPGHDILSTMPLDYDPEVFTDYKGYDFLDGTSMAAPYVSGAAAILMSEGYSADETYARLLVGARKRPLVGQKLVLAGNLDVQGALKAKARPLYAPSVKGVTYALWDLSKDSFKLRFRLRNIWKGARSSQLRIRSADVPALAGLYRIRQSSFNTGAWASGEEKTLSVDIDVLDRRVSSELNLFVEVTDSEGVVQSIRVPFIVSTRITRDGGHPAMRSIPVLSGTQMPNSTLYSIHSNDGSPRADFIAIAGGQREWKLQLVLEKQGGYVFGTPRSIPAMRNAGLRGRMRMDVNFDGKPEYVLTFARDGERPTGGARNSGSTGPARATVWFEIFYLDEAGKDVLPPTTYKNQVVDMPLDHLSWIRLGDRLVQAWVRVGTQPAAEKPAYDPWNPKPEDRPEPRIYYHDPSTEDGVRSIAAPKNHYFEGAFRQTPEQRRKGEMTVLSFDSRDYVTRYFTSKVTGDLKLGSQTRVEMTEYRSLRQLETMNLIHLQGEDRASFTVAGSSGVNDQRITALFVDGGLKAKDQSVVPADRTDVAYRVMGAFFDESSQSLSSFSQANYSFLYHDHTTVNPMETSLRRYTFLPGSMFLRLFTPVVTEQRGERTGGLFVADTFGAYVGSEIIAPLRDTSGRTVAITRPASLRFYVPQMSEAEQDQQCEWLDPRPASKTSPSEAVYFCGDRFLRIPYRF